MPIGTIGSLDIFPQTIDIGRLTGGPLGVSNGGTGNTSFPTGSILLGNGSGPLSSLNLGAGQIPIGSSTTTPPVAANLTQGSGIVITNAPGSITISATGGGTGFVWVDQTTPTVMAVNTGYIANDAASRLLLTLPATATEGDVIRVAGKNAMGWRIQQNAGQSIQFGTAASTIGVGGSLSSSTQFDAVELLCIVSGANATFIVISLIGNPTIV